MFPCVANGVVSAQKKLIANSWVEKFKMLYCESQAAATHDAMSGSPSPITPDLANIWGRMDFDI